MMRLKPNRALFRNGIFTGIFIGLSGLLLPSTIYGQGQARQTGRVQLGKPSAAEHNQDRPEKFFEILGKSVASSRLDAIAELLPQHYRANFERDVQRLGAKMDPQVHQAAARFLRDTTLVFKNKKGLFLDLARDEKLPVSKDVFRHYDRFVQMLMVLSNSELTDQAALRRFDLKAFLGDEGNSLLNLLMQAKFVTPEAQALKAPFDVLPKIKAITRKWNVNGAIVQLTAGESVMNVPMVKEYNRWLPVDYNDGIKAFQASFSGFVDNMDVSQPGAEGRRQASLLAIELASEVVRGINEAQTKDELLAAVRPALVLLGGGQTSNSSNAMLANGQTIAYLIQDLYLNHRKPAYPVSGRYRNSTDYFKDLAAMNGDNNFMAMLGADGDPEIEFGKPDSLTKENNRWCLVESTIDGKSPLLFTSNLDIRALNDPSFDQAARTVKGPVIVIFRDGSGKVLKSPGEILLHLKGFNKVLRP